MTSNCLTTTVEIMQKHYVYQINTISDKVQQNTGITIQQVTQTPDRTFALDHDMKRQAGDMLQ